MEKTKETLLNRVVENAIDFLERSLDEFEDTPKYSVIHFYTAIELFLKARLMADDWTLIVSKRRNQKPDWEKFKEGDFISVGLNEIKGIINKDKFYRNEFESFKKLSIHRNKMVHFYHSATTESSYKELMDSLAKEHLSAWYMLVRLLQDKWDEYFYKWQEQISDITDKLSKIREYLQVVYEDCLPGIIKMKAEGIAFKECPVCKYESVVYGEVLDNFTVGSCLVCNFEEPILKIICPDCDSPVTFVSEGRGDCPECGRSFEPEDLVELLTENIPRNKEFLEAGLPAHCTFCDGLETVVEYCDNYLCLNCFQLFDDYELDTCGYCGAVNAGKLEDSSLLGCVHCDGSLGQNMAKDD